jgi:hypothetical protein
VLPLLALTKVVGVASNTEGVARWCCCVAGATLASAGETDVVHGAWGTASALLTLQQRSRKKYMRCTKRNAPLKVCCDRHTHDLLLHGLAGRRRLLKS